MLHKLNEAIDFIGWRVERFSRNGHDAPAEMWAQLDALKKAREAAGEGKSDKDIREILSPVGIKF